MYPSWPWTHSFWLGLPKCWDAGVRHNAWLSPLCLMTLLCYILLASRWDLLFFSSFPKPPLEVFWTSITYTKEAQMVSQRFRLSLCPLGFKCRYYKMRLIVSHSGFVSGADWRSTSGPFVPTLCQALGLVVRLWLFLITRQWHCPSVLAACQWQLCSLASLPSRRVSYTLLCLPTLCIETRSRLLGTGGMNSHKL